MNIFLTFVMSCPICGTHLNWLPVAKESDPHLIEHQRLAGTEYCEYFGKVFEAPTLELKEVKREATHG